MGFLLNLLSLAASGGAVWMYYQCWIGAHSRMDALISLGLGVAAVFLAFQGFFCAVEREEKAKKRVYRRRRTGKDNRKRSRHTLDLLLLLVLSLFGAGNCLYYFWFRFLRTTGVPTVLIGILVVVAAIPINIKGWQVEDSSDKVCVKAAFVGIWEFATLYRMLLVTASGRVDVFNELMREEYLHSVLAWPTLLKAILGIGIIAFAISVIHLLKSRAVEEIWVILTIAVDVFLAIHAYHFLLGLPGIWFLAFATIGLVSGVVMMVGCLFVPFAMLLPNTAGALVSSGRSGPSGGSSGVPEEPDLSRSRTALPNIIYDSQRRRWHRQGDYGDHTDYHDDDGNMVTIYHVEISGHSANTDQGMFYWP